MAKLIDQRQVYTTRFTIELDDSEVIALYELMDNCSDAKELDSLWEIIRPFGEKNEIPF